MGVDRLFDIKDDLYKKHPEKNDIFAGRHSSGWSFTSVKYYHEQSDLLSMGWLQLGLLKGAKVGTVIRNCPEWNLIDMSLLQIGAVQVPVYPTLSLSNFLYILTEAEVEYLIIHDQSIYNRLHSILPRLKKLIRVFSLDAVQAIPTLKWVVEQGLNHACLPELEKVKSSILPEDLATIIYTSGTTGEPKGVMLSHKNLLSNSGEALKIFNQNPAERALSFLPLCHVLERMMNYTYQQAAVSIYYCDRMDQLSDFIKDAKPEMLTAVPRILEKTYAKILRNGRKFKGIKKLVFCWAVGVGKNYDPCLPLSLTYRLKLAIARRLVFSHWKQALGGRLDVIVIGGASLREEIARIFWAAGFKVMEGYGLTETSPVVAVSTFEKGGMKIGTVGQVLPGMEAMIAKDGEILARGNGLMMGYFKRADLTAELIDEKGWFHTGDIGSFDGKFLKITGRKKEMFKTSGGKYIAPQYLETVLRTSPFIEQALVIGEGKNFAAALLVPDMEYIEDWCKLKSYPCPMLSQINRHDFIVKRIAKEIQNINETLDQTERLRKTIIVTDEWTVENGLLSATLKLKREALLHKYKNEIASIYFNS